MAGPYEAEDKAAADLLRSLDDMILADIQRVKDTHGRKSGCITPEEYIRRLRQRRNKGSKT